MADGSRKTDDSLELGSPVRSCNPFIYPERRIITSSLLNNYSKKCKKVGKSRVVKPENLKPSIVDLKFFL
jgi:hypothetical protein